MELLDIKAVCALVGGNRPLNPCSIYRYIQREIWPKPIRVGGNSRWIRSECEQALQDMINGRA